MKDSRWTDTKRNEVKHPKPKSGEALRSGITELKANLANQKRDMPESSSRMED